MAHVHAHIGEDLSIDSLARRAGVSRAVFNRRFKTATLLSTLQYIKALRLSEASMPIARGEGISDAATAVGYHNSSQFSREFSPEIRDVPAGVGTGVGCTVDFR